MSTPKAQPVNYGVRFSSGDAHGNRVCGCCVKQVDEHLKTYLQQITKRCITRHTKKRLWTCSMIRYKQLMKWRTWTDLKKTGLTNDFRLDFKAHVEVMNELESARAEGRLSDLGSKWLKLNTCCIITDCIMMKDNDGEYVPSQPAAVGIWSSSSFEYLVRAKGNNKLDPVMEAKLRDKGQTVVLRKEDSGMDQGRKYILEKHIVAEYCEPSEDDESDEEKTQYSEVYLMRNMKWYEKKNNVGRHMRWGSRHIGQIPVTPRIPGSSASTTWMRDCDKSD